MSRLGYTGEIAAYDVAERTDQDGRHIQQLKPDTKLNQAGFVVLATPGAVHAAAIPLLRTSDAPILVEKPLCLNSGELKQWNDFAGSRTAGVYVCQNYRFKSNVAAMMQHLSRYNPGQLVRADVVFHSPSVGKESRPWARDERRAQTLLLDYAIHFVDVACMFNTAKWSIAHSRFEMDNLNATGLIEGRLESPTYPVNLVLRQGFMPRRARVFFTFQNYSISLGFFPDTFVAHMADDSPALYAAEKKASFRGSMNKIIDKLTGRDSDRSHDATYAAAVADKDLGKSITVQSVTPFYQAMFELAQAVYGSA